MESYDNNFRSHTSSNAFEIAKPITFVMNLLSSGALILCLMTVMGYGHITLKTLSFDHRNSVKLSLANHWANTRCISIVIRLSQPAMNIIFLLILTEDLDMGMCFEGG